VLSCPGILPRRLSDSRLLFIQWRDHQLFWNQLNTIRHMRTLYLDESGDHDLINIDPQYPVFVLGGVIVKNRDIEYIETRVRQFKRDVLGSDDLILHTADITRNRKGFERLKDPVLRDKFFAALNALMTELPYSVVACAIRKREHAIAYGWRALDPYHFSLHVLLERFCYDGGGVVIAESRNERLDRALDRAFQRLTATGTEYVDPGLLNARIERMQCHGKAENIAGMQLADLIVTPVGRFVLGKPVKEDYNVVKSKFRGAPNNIEGRGLVILPKVQRG
jgi:hypothetical protein